MTLLILENFFAGTPLERNESCGGHFREEHQTAEGEATRDDENFAHAAVWEYKGEGKRSQSVIKKSLNMKTLNLR